MLDLNGGQQNTSISDFFSRAHGQLQERLQRKEERDSCAHTHSLPYALTSISASRRCGEETSTLLRVDDEFPRPVGRWRRSHGKSQHVRV